MKFVSPLYIYPAMRIFQILPLLPVLALVSLTLPACTDQPDPVTRDFAPSRDTLRYYYRDARLYHLACKNAIVFALPGIPQDSVGFYTFEWKPGDSPAADQAFSQGGEYQVKLTYNNVSKVTFVSVEFTDQYVRLPEYFTPNGDGTNDILWVQYPGCVSFSSFDWKIFDTDGGGRVLYEGTDPAEGWNGKDKSGELQPDGAYYSILKATATDGTELELKTSVLITR